METNNVPPPTPQIKPAPSLLETLSKFMVMYIAFNFISNSFGGSGGGKSLNSDVDKVSSYSNVITPIESIKKSIEAKDSKVKSNEQLKKLFISTGIPVPLDDFVAPVFPTHSQDFLPLNKVHTCTLNQGPNVTIDMIVVISDSPTPPNHPLESFNLNSFLHVWYIKDIVYDWTYANSQKLSLNITATDLIKKNMTGIYAHVYANSTSLSFSKTFPLIVYKMKRKTTVLRNLLDSKTTTSSSSSSSSSSSQSLPLPLSEMESSENVTLIVPYYKPTLDISLILDVLPMLRNQIPSAIAKHLDFVLTQQQQQENVKDSDSFTYYDGRYHPLLYHNDFWLLSKHYIEINETTATLLPLTLSYSHLSFWQWQLQASMQSQWDVQKSSGMGGSSDKETDMIRETLLETSPWLLVLTMIVSLLHSLFDILAFRNDINFWKNKKNMVGMSVRSLGMNCVFQTIILLYLFDNDTSYLILFSSTVGLGIEYWKLTKAFNFNLKWRTNTNNNLNIEGGGNEEETREGNGSNQNNTRTPWFSLPQLSWKLSDSYAGQKTQEHDNTATQHLLYLVWPLLLGYSSYSLVYSEHKSVYSWLLNSAVGFVYAFGFIMMTPQLFINYKLKSVAHMPWKAMIYKALNTFIDDLFAFIIKMPTLHRLACLRDDAIFFVYLYQTWTYRVDHSRTNEFGQGGGTDEASPLPIGEEKEEGMDGLAPGGEETKKY